ncbi:hypothetical protein DY000_02033722 [Brassica cretica]|uniref:Uncharacterized protein n=1 Tax=Brassica cretica TaxID=69181 RepID=A0ABQ7DRF0_BRACR|nr:hypothetical protein DY000_02033722 [Brassica cretica]
MDSNAGSSVARRRRRLLTVSHFFVSLFLLVTLLLHDLLSSLMMAQVPDLTLMTCNFLPLVKSSQISDLLMLRHTLLSLSPMMINFLPLGKIYPVRFWWECGSCTSPPCPILVGTISLNGSEHYYQTILARNLLFEDPNNDPGLIFGSEKSPWIQHGNAGVHMFCLESMLVPLESEVKFTSLFVRVKESSALMSELSQEKTISAMFWCERDIIFGSYISGFVKLECCSCYTYGCHSLQAVKSLFVEWQNLFPTRLTVLVQCFTKHLLKSSQSRSFSTNNFWPTLPKCMRRPQLVTSTSSQCSVSSPNLRLLKLKTNSPLKLSFTVKFHQPSSRQGRERSLSTSSFSKERIILQTSLFVRDRLIPIAISEKLFNSFTVLLSCLVVYMRPEDATRLVLVMCSGGIGVPHGVLGDIWVHLELKKGDLGDHWTSRAWERHHGATP